MLHDHRGRGVRGSLRTQSVTRRTDLGAPPPLGAPFLNVSDGVSTKGWHCFCPTPYDQTVRHGGVGYVSEGCFPPAAPAVDSVCQCSDLLLEEKGNCASLSTYPTHHPVKARHSDEPVLFYGFTFSITIGALLES